MNIFMLDRNITKCAEYHNDKHVVKMILEYAQLLSTAHRVLDPDGYSPNLYKATHINHPCAIWVRESALNYKWLYNLWVALSKEFEFRYFKIHKTHGDLRYDLRKLPRGIPRTGFTDPPQCMPDEYKHEDVVLAYRNYYIHGKKDLAQWSFHGKPDWY
jgi:hypothetical protein